MAKKKAATPAASKKTAAPKKATSKKDSVKKSTKKGDLPGQKVMKHGPKKVPEIEAAGASYAEKSAAVDAAKEKLKNAEGVVFDLLKKKRTKSYTVAGYSFARVSNGEKLSVTKAKN